MNSKIEAAEKRLREMLEEFYNEQCFGDVGMYKMKALARVVEIECEACEGSGKKPCVSDGVCHSSDYTDNYVGVCKHTDCPTCEGTGKTTLLNKWLREVRG